MDDFVESATQNLSQSRPIFYSEADFQHALAWQIQKNHPNYSIRFEYKPPKISERIFVDLWITDDLGESYAIELKYKTRNLDVTVNDEMYNLLDHSAQDLGRYDFLKDVHRVENIVSKNNKVSGFAILLTNDSSYWKTPRDFDTVDADFRIHEGRLVNGSLSWKSNASSGTTMGREKTLEIAGNYQMNWQDYSHIKSIKTKCTCITIWSN